MARASSAAKSPDDRAIDSSSARAPERKPPPGDVAEAKFSAATELSAAMRRPTLRTVSFSTVMTVLAPRGADG